MPFFLGHLVRSPVVKGGPTAQQNKIDDYRECICVCYIGLHHSTSCGEPRNPHSFFSHPIQCFLLPNEV